MVRGERNCGIFIQWNIIQPLKGGNSSTQNNLAKPGRHYSEKNEKSQSHKDKYYMISDSRESQILGSREWNGELPGKGVGGWEAAVQQA